MPLEFTNTLVNFMCMMKNIFNKYEDKFVLVFIDDIVVYSKNKYEHEQHLRIVLRECYENTNSTPSLVNVIFTNHKYSTWVT